MTDFKEPITFRRGVTLKNRLLMSPMTTEMSFYNGIVTDNDIRYYENRAAGVGAIITGAMNVAPLGKGWHGAPGIFDDKFIAGLKRLTDAVHAKGAKIFLQLHHAGRMTNSAVLWGAQPLAPSAVAAERPGAEVPRAMTAEEVLDTIEAFKQGAFRAIEAGFDGVELHGANTYLIQQFFSPHSNRRTDEWGGTLEKRYHFIDRLVATVTEAIDQEGPRDFIVGYRFSPEEYETPGIRMDDTKYLIKHLRETTLDYLHLSMNDLRRKSVSDAYQEKPIMAYIHEFIAGKIPLIGVGGIQTTQDVDDTLTNAEMAAVGTSLLIDPNWAEKTLAGKGDMIRTRADLPQEDNVDRDAGGTLWEFVHHMRPDKNY
ncbi:NADH-dependent flavin oxidoreductase [Enterococcus hirae]|nr:NADH-dependent flavin oxidoreductase [Enterococcus hirae]